MNSPTQEINGGISAEAIQSMTVMNEGKLAILYYDENQALQRVVIDSEAWFVSEVIREMKSANPRIDIL